MFTHAASVLHAIAFDRGRLTEGTYDTALNEASKFELLDILPTPTRVAKHGTCSQYFGRVDWSLGV